MVAATYRSPPIGPVTVNVQEPELKSTRPIEVKPPGPVRVNALAFAILKTKVTAVPVLVPVKIWPPWILMPTPCTAATVLVLNVYNSGIMA